MNLEKSIKASTTDKKIKNELEDRRLRNSVLQKSLKKWSWIFARTFILLSISFLILYPIAYMISSALRPSADLKDPSIVWIPSKVILTNITNTFKTMKYPTALINTIELALVCAILQTISCSIVGYGFARFKFKYREILFALVIFTIIVPPQTIGLPVFLQFRYFDFFGILKLIGLITGQDLYINMIDKIYTLYLPAIFATGIRSGLFLYIYRQFFRGMPKELEEAAYIDGCGPIKTFVKIAIPNAGPSIVPVFLFSFVWYWNDYFNVTMYFNKKRTLALALANLRSELSNTIFASGTGSIYNIFDCIVYLQTGSLLYIIPLLIIYLILQRRFTESIQATGIKA